MSVRVFDVEWPELNQTVSRLTATLEPASVTYTGPGEDHILYEDTQGGVVCYQMLDLSQLTQEGRIFQPTAVNVQRPYDSPAGSKFNALPAIETEEYFFIVYSPVMNPNDMSVSAINIINSINSFKQAGFNVSDEGIITVLGDNEVMNSEQLLFGQSSFYTVDLAHALSINNGLFPAGGPNVLLTNSMMKTEVNQYGSMNPIFGPRLHCFRVIIARDQVMTGVVAPADPIATAIGLNSMKYSPVQIQVMTREVELSNGDYVIAASNELTSMTPQLRQD